MQFEVHRLCLDLLSAHPVQTGDVLDANRIRGSLGAALRRIDCHADCPSPRQCPYQLPCLYRRFFDPVWIGGPSGYRDAPRPFVLRSNRHDGNGFELLLFERTPNLEQLSMALENVAASLQLGDHEIRRKPSLTFPLSGPKPRRGGELKLRFETATELKSSGKVAREPDFFVLLERLVERLWALGARYQDWPGEVSFAAQLDDARGVRLIAYDWKRVEEQIRTSVRSGSPHALGGFVGWARYAGEIGPFLPLLEIAQWIGVGRQTVWGKGQIRIEQFVPALDAGEGQG